LVSVLKPLHGAEARLRDNLHGYFQQDYPHFELVFCARQDDDAGLQVARELARQFPKVSSRFLTAGEPALANAKPLSVATMIEAGKGEILIMSDSDVPAPSDYVRRISAPLRDPKIGVVTCMYRGAPLNEFWSRIEALGMSVEMNSGVLIA